MEAFGSRWPTVRRVGGSLTFCGKTTFWSSGGWIDLDEITRMSATAFASSCGKGSSSEP
jgi:hypothetical protein